MIPLEEILNQSAKAAPPMHRRLVGLCTPYANLGEPHDDHDTVAAGMLVARTRAPLGGGGL